MKYFERFSTNTEELTLKLRVFVTPVLCLMMLFGPVSGIRADETYDLITAPGIESTLWNDDPDPRYRDTSTTSTSLTEQTRLMGEKYSQSGRTQVIVAHSQGGLRSAAYAIDHPDRVRALVTVGSPMRGYRALADRNRLERDVNNAVNTILDGAFSVFGFGGVAQALGNAGVSTAQGLVDYVLPAFGLDSEDDSINIARMALWSEGDAEGIRDLDPNGDFITNEIAPQRTQTRAGYWARVPNGYRWVVRYKRITRRWRRIRIPYLARVQQYRSVWVPPTYEYVPQLSRDIAVAFIVGTESDPLKLAAAALDDYSESELRDIKNVAQSVFWGAEVYWGTLRFTPVWGSTRRWINQNYNAAQDARQWVENYKRNYGRMLGDTQNDGFIAAGDQWWDLDAFGGHSAVDAWENGVKPVPEHHIGEMTAASIWGTGSGGLTAAQIRPGGALSEVSIALGLGNSLNGVYSGDP